MADIKGPAFSARINISKAQQTTILEVLVASVIVGVAVVLSVWLIKYINFNATVIGEKNLAIEGYETSLKNIAILEDNVMEMTNNSDLESVARESLAECYDENGKKIDFYKEYQKAQSESERERYLQMTQMCSALRVIPDALPSKENTEAALSSLNQLFLWADASPDNLAPDTTKTITEEELAEKDETDLQTISLRASMESDDNAVFRSLSMIERSIREFDVKRLSFEWNSSGSLSVQARIDTYYSGELKTRETTKTVKATEEKKK